MNPQFLEKILPKKELKEVKHEIEFYGAAKVLSEYVGWSWSPEKSKIKYWLHGWMYKNQKHVRQIKFWGEKNEPYFCHTKAQERFLKNQSHNLTKAIGAPFVYVPAQNIEKIQGSILLMPPHCTKNSPQKYNENAFLDSILPVLSDFKYIFACVTPDDAEQGNWIHELKKRKINILEGATLYDQNALYRMRMIFEMFDVILAPNLGSHFPYAGLCGCRLSWFGDYEYPKKADFKDDPFYQRYPEILKYEIEENLSGYLERTYSKLRLSPGEARSHRVWSEEQLGINYKQKPEKIIKLLEKGIKPSFFSAFMD